VGGLGGGADDLRAQRFLDRLLFPAHLVGHRDDEPVPLDGSHHGQAGAGVAAGRLDQRVLTGPGPPGLFQAFHHPDGDAVLHAAAGVEELALGVQLAVEVGPDVIEPDHGRVTHDLENVVMNHW
jgi:hypothetical protein